MRPGEARRRLVGPVLLIASCLLAGCATGSGRRASTPTSTSSSTDASTTKPELERNPVTSSPADPVASTTAAVDTTTTKVDRTTLPSSTAPPTTVDPIASHEITTTLFDRGRLPLTVTGTQAGAGGIVSAKSWGVVSAPSDAGGPFPLAIVLHGAHAFCATNGRSRVWPCADAAGDPTGGEVPNHDGMSYLTEALARRGFVAIAVGVNAEYAVDVGLVGAVSAAIIERDVVVPLSSPASAVGGALPIDASIVDLTRVVLVGHSRGGAVAAVIGRSDADRRIGVAVSGMVLLAPTSDTVSPDGLADVPTAVVLGSCDGDTGVDGGEFATAALTRKRQAPVALVLLHGATHNAINDRLAEEPMVPGRPGCGDAERLTPKAQRGALADLVPDLARSVLGEPPRDPRNKAFDTMRADDRVTAQSRVVHIDGRSRSVLIDPVAPWPPAGASAIGFVPTLCPGGISSPYRSPGTEPCHRVELPEVVGRPASIHLAWSAVGASVSIPVVPAVTHRTLVLRLYADPVATAPGEVLLSVTDTSGWSSTFSVTVPTVGEPIGDLDVRRGAVLWSERRVTIPTGLSSVTLSIIGPSSGAIDLVGADLLPVGT